MNVNIYSSGSKGNAYSVSDGFTMLLLEAGITWSELQRALRFKVSELSGVLVSHEHSDHIKAASKLIKYGVDLYASAGTLKAVGLSGHRVHSVQPLKGFAIGTFRILPFDVEHDAAEPLGYLIESLKTSEKLLYFTDTAYVKYKFSGLTHIMGECNYSFDIMHDNVCDGDVDVTVASRVTSSHMSLNTFLRFLRVTDKSKLKELYVLHMSDNNSKESVFAQEVQAAVGDSVKVILA